ncbi:MAG: ATP-grasp domain-containing protein [Acidobacteriota bacterium]|nr:ATP-grasp domain-containing protein [Acidobacteriota bacterium]
MNVLVVSPGYPGEVGYFTRGLAATGARVFGIGDQPRSALAEEVQDCLTAHLHVPNLWDLDQTAQRVTHEAHSNGIRFHRIECLWEPGMMLAAKLREVLGVPGLNMVQTHPFRDKEAMKQTLDAAGIRTPRHRHARTLDECRDAAREIGYPLIIKPISGAGSSDTHRVDSDDELSRVLPLLGHVEDVSVEEFIDGEEFTYDTICANGEILYENIGYYRPRPLQQKQFEWISPSCVCVRDIGVSHLADGRRMGHEVIAALAYDTGFTHMEWYRKADGEVVFGEIGARPAGARLVEAMCFSSDADIFRAWAEAICHGRLLHPVERHYNAGIVFKRARGEGRIRRIDGVDKIREEFGHHLVKVDLLPIGAQRRDWQQAQISDGYLIVRHEDLDATFSMADRIADEVQLYAE